MRRRNWFRLSFCQGWTTATLCAHVFVATKQFFCRKKSMLVATNKIMFVATKYFCRNKRLVGTNTYLSPPNVCCDKKQVLSPQAYFCRDKNICGKRLLLQNILSRLVATNTCLSRQKFCHHKHTFVATKIMFEAAPANDRFLPCAIVEELNLLLPTCQTSLSTSLLALCVLQAPVCSVSTHETQQVWKTCFLKHRTSGLDLSLSLSPSPIYAVLQVFPPSDPIRKRSSSKSICAEDIHSKADSFLCIYMCVCVAPVLFYF